jgi:hypothetical protein
MLRSAADRFQPIYFPEEEACGLASAVRLTIATSFEMHSPFDTASANWKDRIAGLVGSLVNLKPLAAKCKHFGHERKIVEAAVAVQGCEDLLAAPDFYPVSGAEPEVWTGYRILHCVPFPAGEL